MRRHSAWLILLSLTAVLTLSGCGGGSSGSSGGSTPSAPIDIPSGETEMVTSKSYLVHPGDILLKTSDPTVISVAHKSGTETSTVSLVEGSAVIRRP